MGMSITLIDINAGFLVLIKLVAKITGTDRAGAGVMA